MSENKSPIPKIPTSTVPVPPVKKVQKSNIVSLEKGKLPPQAIDLEEAVLGAILIDRKAIEEVYHLLDVKVFYKEHHGIIYQAIKNLYDNQIGIDLLTVSTELKRMNKLATIGGDFYLITLNQKVCSSAHIQYHSRVIIQKYILRELIRVGNDMIVKSYHEDPDVFQLMENVELEMLSINNVAIREEQVDDTDPIEALKKKIERVRSGEAPGIGFGISEFDEWCGGAQERELITLAARTGMGKTSAMLAVAGNIVLNKSQPVAFFSLEMSNIDLLYRLSSRLSGISYTKIRKGEISDSELVKVEHAIKYLQESDLKIYDTFIHKNIYERIESKIRELVKKGVKFFIIDYVQLIKLAKESSDRTGDLSKITRQLKGLCNELNITIIMLAQVNRGTDSRSGSKIPMLSDLKQSGSIEEDSDMVIFLVRDAYYQLEKNSSLELPPHVIGDTQFVVAKGRSTGTRIFRTYLDINSYNISSYHDNFQN